MGNLASASKAALKFAAERKTVTEKVKKGHSASKKADKVAAEKETAAKKMQLEAIKAAKTAKGANRVFRQETKKLDVLSAAAEESERNMEKTTKSTDLME